VCQKIYFISYYQNKFICRPKLCSTVVRHYTLFQPRSEVNYIFYSIVLTQILNAADFLLFSVSRPIIYIGDDFAGDIIVQFYLQVT